MRTKTKTLGLLATLALALALSAVAAASSLATTIKGQGSSLQKVAQTEVWGPSFKTAGEGTVEYNPSGSAAGLKAFGVEEKESPKSTGDVFIGTDDAPNEAQLKQMEKEANGTFGSEEKGQDLVIPVAQAAIAVMVNPPTGCTVKEITNKNLEEVWRGTLTEWSKVEKSSGCGTAKITRVVRADGSGTTYQYKHYLFEINQNKLPGNKGGSGKTWKELQPEEALNKEWPEGEEGGKKLSEVVRPEKTGGGAEAEKVFKTEGAIGYAALADARKPFNEEKEGNHYHWLAIENESTSKFVFPGTSAAEPSKTTGSANCAKTQYSGNIPTSIKADGNWSEVYGGNPGKSEKFKNPNYPICTLTWDVALKSAKTAGLTEAEGETSGKYMTWITATAKGQKEIETKHDYEALPAGTTSILKIGQELATKVGK